MNDIDYKPTPPAKPYYMIHGADNAYYACRSEKPLLSLKCMFSGPATYATDGGGRYIVDDSGYLILNHQQPYTMVKEGVVPVTSFCVFFGTEFVSDIVRASALPDGPLLDEPVETVDQPYHFFEKIYPHDELVSPHVHSIRAKVEQADSDQSGLEEALHSLFLAMMQTQRNVFREIEQLPAARYATRIELYQRLHQARDYIHASLDEPIALADIAQVVYLSPHHLLRSFKEVFGMTPHTYLTQKRIERAQYLLANTSASITDICLTIGFQSPASFSNLFRRVTGMSPRGYRQQSTKYSL